MPIPLPWIQKQNEMGKMARDFLGKVLEAEPLQPGSKGQNRHDLPGHKTPCRDNDAEGRYWRKSPTNELAMFNMGMLTIQSVV